MKIVRVEPSNGELITKGSGDTAIIPVFDRSKIIEDPITKHKVRKGVKIDPASTMVTIAAAGLAVQVVGLLISIFRSPKKESITDGNS